MLIIGKLDFKISSVGTLDTLPMGPCADKDCYLYAVVIAVPLGSGREMLGAGVVLILVLSALGAAEERDTSSTRCNVSFVDHKLMNSLFVSRLGR